MRTKQIQTESSPTILVQDEKGPCALIAIVNTLVLMDTPMAAWLSGKTEVSPADVVSKLGEMLQDKHVGKTDDLMRFLPLLHTGLGVNPRFNGTFAPSHELSIFEAFEVPLIHGWVFGEVEAEAVGVDHESMSRLSQVSYEDYATLQATGDNPKDRKLLHKFAVSYKHQLTPSGIAHIYQSALKPAVLFWNNHFSTVLRHDDKLYMLVSDAGLAETPEVVWEELSLFGAGQFVDGSYNGAPVEPDTSGDAELARQLEIEERNRATERAARRHAAYKQHEKPEVSILDKTPEAIFREVNKHKQAKKAEKAAQKAASRNASRNASRDGTPDPEGKKSSSKSEFGCTIA